MESRNRYEDKVFTIPNILSMVRIALVPAVVWLYCWHKDYALAGILILISGFTDMADGFVARKFNMVSNLGRMLDPFADKLTQAATLVCLATRYPLMLLPFILMVFKESFMLIAGSLVVRRLGHSFNALWHGKLATAALYGTIAVHLFWDPIPDTMSLGCIIVCAVLIALSFLLYGIFAMGVLRAKPQEAAPQQRTSA